MVGGSMLHIQSEKVMKNDASDYTIQMATPQQARHHVPGRDYLRRKPALKYTIAAQRGKGGNQATASPYRPAKDFISRNQELIASGTRNGSVAQ